ncbi:MAG: YciI family protein [Flavobacteriaceae bacterium]|jgi:hypothetical protein|nr:YciI family protein [Flavobacteriaceae bacterium]
MSTFLLILHENLDILSNMDEENMSDLMHAHIEWTEKLGSKGQLISGEGLDDSGIIIEGRERKIKEFPFVSNGYMVGGYYLIKANDIQEAYEIALDCPCHLWGGTTEVRAIAAY